MNEPTIEFWYDFASPYCYLAASRLERLAAGKPLRLAWRPFLLGPIFKQRSHDPSPFQNPSLVERRYRWRDVQRLCAAEGLPLRLPTTYPRNGLLAARAALIALDEGWGPAFSRAVYHANFAEDRDIAAADVIAGIVAACGGDGAAVLAQAATASNKERLIRLGDEAMARGIFGAPSFLIGGEVFWGNDRLDQAVAWAVSPLDLPRL
jgi:2-hydroxychromene-2-carboxylate isomerase